MLIVLGTGDVALTCARYAARVAGGRRKSAHEFRPIESMVASHWLNSLSHAERPHSVLSLLLAWSSLRAPDSWAFSTLRRTTGICANVVQQQQQALLARQRRAAHSKSAISGQFSFSATDYFFVSSYLARALVQAASAGDFITSAGPEHSAICGSMLGTCLYVFGKHLIKT